MTDSIALRPVAIDLGSGTCGFVAALVTVGPSTISVVAAESLSVDTADTTATVEAIITLLVVHRCDCLVLELGQLFGLANVAATVAVGNALGACREIAGGLMLEARRRGIPVHKITRRSWSARLVPRVKGGVSNADAAAAAVAGLTDAEAAMFRGDKGQHCRDALGALRGFLQREAQTAGVEAKRTARIEASKAPPVPRGPRLNRRPQVRTDEQKTRQQAAARLKQGWMRDEAGAWTKPPRKAHMCSKCGGRKVAHYQGLPCPPQEASDARPMVERREPVGGEPGAEPMADDRDGQ